MHFQRGFGVGGGDVSLVLRQAVRLVQILEPEGDTADFGVQATEIRAEHTVEVNDLQISEELGGREELVVAPAPVEDGAVDRDEGPELLDGDRQRLAVLHPRCLLVVDGLRLPSSREAGESPRGAGLVLALAGGVE